MRVVVVTAFPADPAAPHGGVESVSVNLVRALQAFDDLELHVVTTDRSRAGSARYDWEGVTVHRLPHSGKRVLRDATGPGRRTVSQYVMSLRPELVHAHDVYGLMVQGLPVPRVFTVHGFIYGDTLVSGEPLAWLRSKIWKRIETAGWADQPHIISISPYVRERLSGFTNARIHDIDNPIAPSFFEIPRTEQPGTLFSAALISPRKNTLTLIDAFERLVRQGVDAQLRLAGTAPQQDYERRVRERIASADLQDHVHLLGRLTTDQVRAELSRASAFVLVSLEENSPMGIEEAMAAGIPVVTSNRCGMPYMVRDGESGFLVDPDDPDDIAACLRELLCDDELRRRMGRRSAEIARDRFHPDAVARRTREVYLRAAGQHRSCHACC